MEHGTPQSFTSANLQCGSQSKVPENIPSPDDLDHLALEAPITAVNSMTIASAQRLDRSQPSPRTNESVKGVNQEVRQSNWTGHDYNDVVSRGVVSEPHARRLFQLYMANANVFLPLFDPITDSFDAVRQQSPFSLAVILAVGSNAERESVPEALTASVRCLCEAKYLAKKSLFSSSPELGTVRGMLLLAAYSDINWFAVCHACQMGEDLGLFERLRSPAELSGDEKVKLEVVSGTSRKPRGRFQDDISEDQIKEILPRNHYLRIASSLRIVQLRETYLQVIRDQKVDARNIESMMISFKEDLAAWFTKWEDELEKDELAERSFQRSSLRLQRDYAFIIICSAILSKPDACSTFSHIAEGTLNTSIHILKIIAADNDYKWHLPWAPTYSALFPAFTACLAYRLGRIHRDHVDWNDLQASFTAVGDILEHYPYAQFATILQDLANLASEHAAEVGTRQESATRCGDLNSGSQLTATSSTIELNDQDTAHDIEPNIRKGQEVHGDVPLELPSLPGSPGYILDFDSFTASIQSSIDMDGYTGL
ncbi:fungal specific transcription factor domain-containing protein [Aspergillus stella-maris]|uniref:fungal specific transcription factor domain-containing protein n=1 Tax=Aspergillus stella-maris TaxID=1810926 RepID=UPI003CCD92D8